MATGFGGSPGLAIIASVAREMEAQRQRELEAQRQAILNRLTATQIRQAEQNIEHGKAREAREATEFDRAQNDRKAAFEELVEQFVTQGRSRELAERLARARMSGSYVDVEADEAKRKKAEEDVRAAEALTEQRRTGAALNRARAQEIREKEKEEKLEPGEAERINAEARLHATREVERFLGQLRNVNNSEGVQERYDAEGVSSPNDATLRRIAAQQAIVSVRKKISEAQARGQKIDSRRVNALLRALADIARVQTTVREPEEEF